jgi:hypothetical protein
MPHQAGLRQLALLVPLFPILLPCVSALAQDNALHTLADASPARSVLLTQAAGAAAGANLGFAGSMAQIASAGGWETSLTLVNLGPAAGEASLSFDANDGSALALPFTFPQQPALGATSVSTFDQNLNANAMLVLDTTGPLSQTVAVGSSQLFTTGNIGGFAIFKSTPNGQEAVVPLETRNASSYMLAFDNTGAVSTGLAIANLAASPASVGVVIRDDTGARVGAGAISLPPQGHNSFMLTGMPAGSVTGSTTANMRGTVEFDTPQGGRISVLGLRANGGALTSLPVLANVGTAGGRLAHVAFGGGWQTVFTLVNTGATSADVTLSFFGDNGGALTLPLSFPQTGGAAIGSSIERAIPAGATLIVVTLGQSSASVVTGSAQLSTTGNVSGFAIFQGGGQEAVVPLEAGSANSYTLAFDDTNGLATGIALANSSGQAAVVPATLRDYTGAMLATTTIGLPTNGHKSLMLPDLFPQAANIRGTLEFDTPASGQIGALGIRATPAGAYTTVPVMTNGSAVADRALAQTGLSIALASIVLQSQVDVLMMAGNPTSCTAPTDGTYSLQTGLTPTTTVPDGTPLYPVNLYYDVNCTKPYITGDVTGVTQTGDSAGVMTETATYYGLNGSKLGTMTLNVDLVETSYATTVNGLGLFTPSSGMHTPIQLGLYCSLPSTTSSISSTSIPCAGAVAQDFPDLSLAIGSVTAITLTPFTPASGGANGVAFTGGGSTVTGAIGSLTLTNPSPPSFVIQGGAAYASTTASGSAAAYSLFPPTPTSWTLADAAHDEQLRISVIDNATRNSTLTITQVSTGKTLATGTMDQSGSGTINYSDGSAATITNWTLAD